MGFGELTELPNLSAWKRANDNFFISGWEGEAVLAKKPKSRVYSATFFRRGTDRADRWRRVRAVLWQEGPFNPLEEATSPRRFAIVGSLADGFLVLFEMVIRREHLREVFNIPWRWETRVWRVTPSIWRLLVQHPDWEHMAERLCLDHSWSSETLNGPIRIELEDRVVDDAARATALFPALQGWIITIKNGLSREDFVSEHHLGVSYDE